MATSRRSRRKSISGNLTDIQKRVRYLETRPSATQLASKTVSTRNIALRAVDENLVADNAIVRRSIAAAAVGTAEIETDSITNDLIATNAVNTDSIAPSSVTTDELATDAVTTDKIATGAVGNTELSGGITDDKLTGLSTPKLIGTITNAQLAGSITEDKIISIPATKLTGTITTSQIGDSQVTDAKISGISGSKIIGGIDGALIVTRSVTASKLAVGTITQTELASDCIGTAQLQDNSVFNSNINAGVVVGSSGTGTINIQNFSIGTGDIFANAITSAKIDTGAVTTAKIGDLQVTRAKINNSAVGTVQIGELQVTTSKIDNGAVTFAKTTGFDNLLTTATVSGTGISRTFSSSGNFRSLDISISAGTGSNQLAIGNHTHASGAVGAHTHSASLLMNSLAISGGAHGHTGQNGSHSHGVTPTGSVSVGAVVTSTLKLKQDISDFTVTDPKNILNLKMKKYKYKNSVRGIQNRYNREWMYGYIAEEVQELGVEQILAYDKNGDPDGIDYGLLSVLVLELVKVQQSEIDSLKEEIQRLKEVI